MRLTALLREAGRNIITGTTRFTLFATILTLTLTGFTVADATLIIQQIAAADHYRTAGGATQILTATGRIDPAACADLTQIPGVTAAGALRQSERKVTIATLPDAPVPTYEVTPGFPNVLGATRAVAAGAVASADVAHALGVTPGDILATDRGPLKISSTYNYPADGRRPGFGYALLAVTTDQSPYDECWVTAFPEITNLRALLFTTMQAGEPTSSDKPQLSQLNPSLGASFNGYGAFSSRITGSAAPVALIISTLIGFIAVRIRRLQLASALHAGIPRGDVVAFILLETAGWSAAAAAITVAAATWATSWAPAANASALAQTLVTIPLTGFAGALIGALAATLATQERHLFNYFKDR